jgi:hypothetical protein
MTAANTEIALRAALNVLRDSIESGRMASGIELEPTARAAHEAAIAELERLLAGVKALASRETAMPPGSSISASRSLCSRRRWTSS